MMKRMKKAMKVSIAKGRGALARVFSGKKAKTVGGLTKSDLVKNKAGKVVSKKRSLLGKKNGAAIKKWAAACTKARKALGIKGFCPVGGKTAKGKDEGFYLVAESHFKKSVFSFRESSSSFSA